MSYAKASDLLRLAQMATGRVGVTLSEIQEAFECDRRTAQRMTSALRDLFPNCDRWIDEDRRPRWRLSAINAALFAPTPDELAVLARSVDNLERDGAATEVQTLHGLEVKIKALIPDADRARIAVDEEAMLQALNLATRPGPRPILNAAVDGTIAEALKSRRCLKIRYRKRDGTQTSRTVAPHGLLLGARRYLVACDAKTITKAMRHYRVEDISEASLCAEWFEPHADFNLAEHAKLGFGSYESSAEMGEVVWRFSPEAADHARNYQFHPDQTVEVEDNGSLLVRFWASGHLEMCWHLYSWGDKVEVLAPAALRDMTSSHRRADFVGLP